MSAGIRTIRMTPLAVLAAVVLLSAPARAQVPDSTNAGAAAAAPARFPPPNPCLEPAYIELKQIPLERMDETQRRLWARLEGACADARLESARRRLGSSFDPQRPDLAHQVVPWLVGSIMFCTTVIMLTNTVR